MQDEVNTKVIAIAIKGGKITAEVLEKALKKFVEETLFRGFLLRYLRDHGLWGVVERTWGVCPSEIPEGAEEPDDLDLLGRRLGCLLRGNRVDRELAGRRLLDAFSQGKVGPLSLQRPGEGGDGA